GWPAHRSPGEPHRWMATHRDPGNGPVDRTPPTGRLTDARPAGRSPRLAGVARLRGAPLAPSRLQPTAADGRRADWPLGPRPPPLPLRAGPEQVAVRQVLEELVRVDLELL